MTKNAIAERDGREARTGRFSMKKNAGAFSTELVTKRGNITLRQAEKAVRDYLREHGEKK